MIKQQQGIARRRVYSERLSMKNNYRSESRMRENLPRGSEGGEGLTLPNPYRRSGSSGAQQQDRLVALEEIKEMAQCLPAFRRERWIARQY